MTSLGSSQLADENRYLNDELNRVETILNSTRAEKDELSIRYNALSDRVSTLWMMIVFFSQFYWKILGKNANFLFVNIL